MFHRETEKEVPFKSTFGRRNFNEYLYDIDHNQYQLKIPGSMEYVSFRIDHKTLNLGLGVGGAGKGFGEIR